MKSETSQLGERGGFSALDPAQLGGLSDGQRDAIARAIAAQGPALIQQGHTQRMLGRVALGGGLAAAAALVLMLRSQPQETKTEVPAVAVAMSCRVDAAPTPITHEGEQGSTIEIGSGIRAVTADATQLSIVEAEPCLTRLALNQGTLTLRARGLRGGSVLVDTPHGQVRAEASFLRVVTLASSTSVSVVEGEAVMRGVQGAENVGAGRAVTVGRHGIERSALSGDEQKSVREAFDAPEAAPERSAAPEAQAKVALVRRVPQGRAQSHSPKGETRPAISPTDLLAQADALWRKGDRDAARQAFRRAAADKGSIGEAAWVRLARLELSTGSHELALTALKARKHRSGAGLLGAEALWLEAQALERALRTDEALKAAEKLIRDYPTSPQAAAARRLVAKGKGP